MEGIIHIPKIIKVPTLLGASGLKIFRILIVMKPRKDMQPPNPSFQSATTSPLSPMPQIKNIKTILMLSEILGEPVLFFNPSIKTPIPKITVNATRKVPVILAVQRMRLRNFFFVIIAFKLATGEKVK